ncbi:MAG TPA: glutamine synthetase beta-grasp domain-containing protein, partial [Candidatus Binataceae bacterium]|nr:glutamine synthetase beta-grasp domain-containing protein [Candidatus Binataceae bacterium]
MTPKQVLQLIKDKGVVQVDIKFIDLLGTWQHFSAPISEFGDEDAFTDGLGFDGSSIRGWSEINNSDMLIIPDPATAVIDPFCKEPTLTLLGNVQDPITREDYPRDPRNLARKAEAYLKSTGIGDLAYFGPEPEFFIFDGVRFDTNQQSSYHFIESNEGVWNSGKESAISGGPNLGYKVKNKGGYFPVPPTDSLQDIRTEMVL